MGLFGWGRIGSAGEAKVFFCGNFASGAGSPRMRVQALSSKRKEASRRDPANSSPGCGSLLAIRGMTVIAFAVGCSYRRTLEEWLARSKISPERVLEFGSYHAIVACIAAGTGIAVVPHSVIHALHAEGEVSILPLPAQFSEATTFLVWPREHRSAALDALRRELGQENTGLNTSSSSSLRPNAVL